MSESAGSPLTAPLRLGVVGHTTLRPDDLPALATAVAAILAELRTRFPGVPVQLLSSLAEGADQLCAEAALAAGVTVVAPLPFPTELYRTRFRSPAARDTLDRLVHHPAVTAFCLREGTDTPADFTRVLADDRRRRQRYVDAADYVARHTQALLAVWDEGRDASPSLTAEIVRLKTRGAAAAGAGPTPPPLEPGIVFSIYAPRTGSAAEPGRVPGETTILPCAGLESASREELFRRAFPAAQAGRRLADAPTGPGGSWSPGTKPGAA